MTDCKILPFTGKRVRHPPQYALTIDGAVCIPIGIRNGKVVARMLKNGGVVTVHLDPETVLFREYERRFEGKIPASQWTADGPEAA